MLQNAYLLAKIGADTAENERDFAEILPKTGNLPFAASLSSFPQYTESRARLAARLACAFVPSYPGGRLCSPNGAKASHHWMQILAFQWHELRVSLTTKSHGETETRRLSMIRIDDAYHTSLQP